MKFVKLWKKWDWIYLWSKNCEFYWSKAHGARIRLSPTELTGKTVRRVLCKRLEKHQNIGGKHNNQYGFRQGRSTDDTINQALEFRPKHGPKICHSLFVDLSHCNLISNTVQDTHGKTSHAYKLSALLLHGQLKTQILWITQYNNIWVLQPQVITSIPRSEPFETWYPFIADQDV